MPRKRVKFKRKLKRKKEDKSKVVSVKDSRPAEEGVEAQEEPHMLDSSKCASKKEKSAKQVHFAFLTEKYQPLVEDDIADQPRDDSIKKNQDKYKTFRKNVGKAFRYSWKCLVVGLQNLSTAYSMPLGATVTVVPEMSRARAHT